jgi:hypothetical protein
MKNKTSAIWIILTGLVFILSCSVIGTGGDDAPDAVATSVAATLTAVQVEADQAHSLPTATILPDGPAAVVPSATPAVPLPLRFALNDTQGSLWVWEAGGMPQKLVDRDHIIEVRLSPDKQIIAFLSSADYINYTLKVIGFDGSNQRVLLSPADFLPLANTPDATGVKPFGWKWTPDGRRIGFVSSPTFEGPGLVLNNDLHFVEVASGVREEFLSPGEGGMFYFSPDGSRLALVEPTSISIINTEGSGRLDDVLTFEMINTASEYMYYPTPLWSPDSQFLLAAIPPTQPFAESPADTRIFRIPADGSAPVIVNHVPSIFFEPVAFSPDADHFTYFEMGSVFGSPPEGLHLVSLPGGEDSLVSGSPSRFLGWSPDSQHFLFTQDSNSVLKIGTAAEEPVFVLDSGDGKFISGKWLSDENYVFMVRRSGDFWTIYLGQVGGGVEVLLEIPFEMAGPVPTFD